MKLGTLRFEESTGHVTADSFSRNPLRDDRPGGGSQYWQQYMLTSMNDTLHAS